MPASERGSYLQLGALRGLLVVRKFKRRIEGLSPELTDPELKIIALCEYAINRYQRERFAEDYPLMAELEKML